MQELNDSFSKETEKALAVKMDNFEKNKQQKLDAIQDKLKEHVSTLYSVNRLLFLFALHALLLRCSF